jgi:hypothetical protein
MAVEEGERVVAIERLAESEEGVPLSVSPEAGPEGGPSSDGSPNGTPSSDEVN